MKKELSGGCGIAMLGVALMIIIFGIIAVFSMRSDGEAGEGSLGLMVLIAILSPFIYWGYSLLYKSLHPGEPVRLTKKATYYGCGALLALGGLLLWAIMTNNHAATEPKPITEITQEPNEPKDSVVITEVMEGDPYQELDELIGLESVKEEVHTLANFAKIQQQRKAQGLKVPKMSFHLVFTGSPGTGKTTVARIVARI